MATILAAPRRLALEPACARHGLLAVLLATLAVRTAAVILFQPPFGVDGDSLAYYSLADTLARTGLPTDQYGNHAFYSPGYVLLLTPVFALLGASIPLALAVNVALSLLSAAMLWALVRRLGGSALAATLAGLAFAAWIPGAFNTASVMRETLATATVIGFALACIAIDPRKPVRGAAVAGLAYGLGLLAGTTILLSAAGALIALWRVRSLPAFAAFLAAAALPVLPYMAATDAWVGRPVLTTNSGFNLYVGHNPAADGRFVSMRDTPMKNAWRENRAKLGEVGAGDWIKGEAIAWAKAHPAQEVRLTLTKLWLFWAPNVPDAQDFAQSKAIASARIVEVAQYLLIVGLAGLALFRRRTRPHEAAVLVAIVAGYWLIHGMVYVIPRYRDPVMPLLIALAALEVAGWMEARRRAA